jgi:hypothetical protein
MFRIELHDAPETTFLRMEGRFAGAWAEDTRAKILGRQLRPDLLVDLSELTFVDSDGERVLLWLAGMGAQFIADSCYSVDVCDRLLLPTLKENNSQLNDIKGCAPGSHGADP